MKYREILQEAKHKISKDWIKHRFKSSQGGVCLLQAIMEASSELKDCRAHGYDAVQLVKANLPENFRMNSITYFNDHKETTKEDVIALLDKAIAWQPKKVLTAEA